MWQAEWDEHDFEPDRPGFETGAVQKLIRLVQRHCVVIISHLFLVARQTRD